LIVQLSKQTVKQLGYFFVALSLSSELSAVRLIHPWAITVV